ncbi:MAG: NACHT domain-containing protein [Candidatus Eisenbacteria sp.]|nr:NACHT domain-containing protein [Candidatus Eisenbacteria bacterium]
MTIKVLISPGQMRFVACRILDYLATPSGRLLYMLAVLVIVIPAGVLLRFIPWKETLVRLSVWAGANPTDPRLGSVIDTLATNLSTAIAACFAVWFGIVRKPTTVLAFLRRRMAPINLGLDRTDLDNFDKYFRAVVSRVDELLPDELRPFWELPALERLTTLPHSRLLHPHCTRRRDDNNVAADQHIDDIWRFLGDEFLFASRVTSPPLMLHGEPGSGKSTILYHLFAERAVRLRQYKNGWIPLLLFAHDLTQADVQRVHSLEDLLVRYFTSAHTRNPGQGLDAAVQLITQKYHQKQFLLIVDGLDELPERDRYFEMIEQLRRLIADDMEHRRGSRNANRYILSCRTDDNPDTFQGSLVEIRPLDFAQSTRYLSAVADLYSHGRFYNQERTRRARNALRGLKESASRSLLRNYMRNPYLLYLIGRYYEAGGEQPAEWLAPVFRSVLKRELGKVHNDRRVAVPGRALLFGPAVDDSESLIRQLEGVIGPFCFERTYDRGEDIDASARLPGREADFYEAALRKGLGVGACLFGNGNSNGALALYHRDPSSSRANEALVNALAAITDRTGHGVLDTLRDLVPLHNLKAFEHEACEVIRRTALAWLKDARLAEVDDPPGLAPSLSRFRHRRMGEYFAAKCLDGSPTALDLLRPRLENAWIREPLRIFAAVAVEPSPLFLAFLQRCKDLTGEPRQVVDVLMNAGAAAEYLPRLRRPRSGSAQHLQDAVLAIATRALEEAYASLVRADGRKLVGDCLTVASQVVTAECWLVLDRQRREVAFRSATEHIDLRCLAQEMLRVTAQGSGRDHVKAYRWLLPLNASFPRLGLSRLQFRMLVAHAWPFFWKEYGEALRETHPTGRSRVLPRLAAQSVNLVSLGWVLAPYFFVWVHCGSLWRFALLAFVLLLQSAAAGFAQLRSWMDFRPAFFKLLPWAIVWGMKLSWARSMALRPSAHQGPIPTSEPRTSPTGGIRGQTPPPPTPPSPPRRNWWRVLAVGGVVIIVALTGWVVRQEVVPQVERWVVRHQHQVLRGRVDDAAIHLSRISTEARQRRDAATADELGALAAEARAYAQQMARYAEESREIQSSPGSSSDSSISGTFEAFQDLGRQARLAADTLEVRARERARVESLLGKMESLRGDWTDLLKQGESIRGEGDESVADPEAETRIITCDKWQQALRNLRSQLSIAQLRPLREQYSDTKEAAAALDTLGRMEDDIAQLRERYEYQVAPSRERKRISSAIADARDLISRGRRVTEGLQRSGRDGVQALSRADRIAREWLNAAVPTRGRLESAQQGLLPTTLVQEAVTVATQLGDLETVVTEQRNAVQDQLAQIRFQEHRKEVDEHIRRGADLLTSQGTEETEQTLRGRRDVLVAWLNTARRIMLGLQPSSEGANRAEAGTLRVQLSSITTEIAAERDRVNDRLAAMALAREEAKAVSQKLQAARADADELLDGAEWKVLARSLNDLKANLTNAPVIEAVARAEHPSLSAVRRALQTLNELGGWQTRVWETASALADFEQRLLDVIERLDASGTGSEAMERRLQERQAEVQAHRKLLDVYRDWQTRHVSSDLGDRLRGTQVELVKKQRRGNEIFLTVVVMSVCFIGAAAIAYIFSSWKQMRELRKIPNTFEDLAGFLKRRGLAVRVALAAVARLEQTAIGMMSQIKGHDQRKSVADALVRKLEALQKELQHWKGENVDRVAGRLQQAIEGIDKERNR